MKFIDPMAQKNKKNRRPPACCESFYVSEKPVILLPWPNLFSDSQLRDIGYTQCCGVPLRRVQILDLDFEANLAKKSAISFQLSSSDGFRSYLDELFHKNRCVYSFVIE